VVPVAIANYIDRSSRRCGGSVMCTYLSRLIPRFNTSKRMQDHSMIGVAENQQ
jgi:hypothetical protein